MGHVYARKIYKKCRGYEGCSPPKTPKCINLQMPISLNEEMALNKSLRPICKMLLMIPAQHQPLTPVFTPLTATC